jgi:hypothetical protein
MNWDEHLSTMLFSYRTTNKVTIGYTPYQLMYGLHPLMPITSGNERNNILMKILTSRITELERLQEAKM